MKVKPLKIKIKEPTPSAADRLYAKHQAIRKAKGLPDPSEYKKKLDSMKSEETELDEGLKKAIGAVATAAALATSPHAHSAFVASPNIAVQQDIMKRDHERRAQQAKEKEGHEASRKRGQEFPLSSHDASKKASNAAPLSDRSKKLLKKEDVEQLDEISSETKASYKSKAQAQVKEMQPWTKKGEYKDLAKNIIAKRKKGIAKVSEETVQEQLYKKGRFVSGPGKKPFKAFVQAAPQNEEVKQPTGELKDACWKGYTAVGMKMKNGRKVPNCVPVKEDTYEPIEAHATLSRKAQIVRDAAKGKKDRQNAKDEASDKFQNEPELSSAIHKT